MANNASNHTPLLKNTCDNLDPKLTKVFLPWALHHPRHLSAYARLSRALKRCKKIRVKEMENGLRVPPALILSITPLCNLNCAGCYAAAAGTTTNNSPKTNTKTKNPLNMQQWRSIIKEASELGVFCFVIAGGEPFLFSGLIDLCQEFKDRLFLILTNGTALNEEYYKRLKGLSHVVIIVSIEGGEELTNVRRGEGVYEKAMNTLNKLNRIGVLTGISVTITRMNYKYWMNTQNIDYLIEQGVRIGVFIEYIPLTPGIPSKKDTQNQPLAYCSGLSDSIAARNNWNIKNDHALILTPGEREKFRAQMLLYRETKPIYIIHSPGDEEYFGGCVSAGRGFAHITPAGDLTPCPISNIATHNLTTSSLREGLASPLFVEIRENEHLLETEGLPCALFAHPKEVEVLAKAVGAYRTNL